MKGASLLALGIGLGAALGVVFENVALGIAIGLSVGSGLFAAHRKTPPKGGPPARRR